MRILFLGGTVFLGRHLVEAALAAGHEVTLFTRGQRNPDLFPSAEKLRGDRSRDLSALKGRQWDRVIDTSGYAPSVVRRSAEALADAAAHYTFISTISVYADMGQSGMDESAPIASLPEGAGEEVTGESYGALKALCEKAVEERMPGRTLVVRPGLIVGPHDQTDRFTYWPRRVSRGGEVLAPGLPGQPVQFIDARDLAEWTLAMSVGGKTGVFNATGPAHPLTLGELLKTCQAVTGSDATFTWVAEPVLLKQRVEPWVEMPLWPTEAAAGIHAIDVRRALTAGLTFRPLAETVRDTLAWDRGRGEGVALRAGISPAREQAVLAAWRAAGA